MMSARDLSKYIKEYYSIEGNKSGGNCHIVLDDVNIDDSAINFSLELCKKNNDLKGLFIMENLLKMRKTARFKSIALSKL